MNPKIEHDDGPEAKKQRVEIDEFEEDENIEEEETTIETNDLVDVDIEKTYGIIERINKDFRLFSGKIKESPADFIVNEIDADGKTVQLTTFDLPTQEDNFEQNKDKNNDPEIVIK